MRGNLKKETIERIYKSLKKSSDELNDRVLDAVHLCGKEVSANLLVDCKNAYDALEDFEIWKDIQEEE